MLLSYLGVIRNYWPMVSFGLLTVFVGNFGQSFFVSWFGEGIQESLGLSAAAYGSSYSGATLVSGLTIMALGGAIDRMALKHFITLSGLGLMVAALLLWQANSLPVLVLGLFMLRFCGQGLMPHTAMTAMSKYFSINRGKAISIASNGIPLGEVLLPVVAVTLIAALGWQRSWLVIALLIPLIFLPVILWLLQQAGPSEAETQGAPAAEQARTAPDGSRSTVLRDPRFWLALPLILAPPFILTGLFIHQGFVLAEKDWSSALFASAFVLYGSAHWATSIATGTLVDRFSATALLRYTGLPFVVGLSIGALLDGGWLAYIMMGMLGIGIGMTGTIVAALWAEVYGTRYLGSIRSLITSLMILSTSASPVLFGFFIDAGGSGRMFLLLMAGYAAISTVLAWASFKAPA